MSGVVVTGLGTVGPAGAGAEAVLAALERGAPLAELELAAGFHDERAPRRAGRIAAGACDGWLPPAEARRMSPPSRAAVASARMALADARLEEAAVAGEGLAVALGTAFGCTTFTARLLDQALEAGPEAMSPILFKETVANAHAGQIALALGAKGANHTVTQREASGLLALARGVDLVRSGRCELALAGAVDEIGPVLHAVLGRFGALARETARPFDRRRDGFVASEGASVLVLEREASARARGATVRARVRAIVRANDPTATASDWGRGEERLAALLRAGLERQGVDPRAIRRVVSGASGARRGDGLEARTLRALFRGDPPPVLAPKGALGEYGGGFLAGALLSAFAPEAPAVRGFEELDTELGIAPHRGGALLPAGPCLVSSLAAAGAAVWMVLEPA